MYENDHSQYVQYFVIILCYVAIFNSAAVNFFCKKAISQIFYSDLQTTLYLDIQPKYKKTWHKNVGGFPDLLRVKTLTRVHNINKNYVINMEYFAAIMSKHHTRSCMGNIRYCQYYLDYFSPLIIHCSLLVVKTFVSSIFLSKYGQTQHKKQYFPCITL